MEGSGCSLSNLVDAAEENTSDSLERKERDASKTNALVPSCFEDFEGRLSLREDDQSH
jgi:hypothetical protein